MGSGSSLCGLHLCAGEVAVVTVDYLVDFYHKFIVSAAHASSNHLQRVYKAFDFEGFNCQRPEWGGRRVVV